MNIIEQDLTSVWHPYTQHGLKQPILPVVSAEGSKLMLEDGREIIDAVSSWWTCIHGHCHPYLVKAISSQAEKLDHVIFAGFTHEPAAELSASLLKYFPWLSKCFFSDDGSTAVEVSLKMALQFHSIRGTRRKKILAFRNSYHGDTFGAMSASGRGLFTEPFEEKLFDVIFCDPPVHGNDSCIGKLRKILEDHGNEISAFIYEPMVMGTAGMIMHDAALLDEMLKMVKSSGAFLIADEVMTGFGRTGKMFASEYTEQKPDLVTLSKGITGGTLPLGCTVASEEIFSLFFSSDRTKTFFHGHSYTANPVICAAARANLELFENENVLDNVARINRAHLNFIKENPSISELHHVRCIGSILAIEFKSSESGYLDPLRDRAYTYFLSRSVLIRPLGNVIYLLPPYCITDDELKLIYSHIKGFIADGFVKG